MPKTCVQITKTDINVWLLLRLTQNDKSVSLSISKRILLYTFSFNYINPFKKLSIEVAFKLLAVSSANKKLDTTIFIASTTLNYK